MEGNRQRTSPVVVALKDKELRRHAVQLAADAVVLARMTERAYARSETKKGSGKRKVIIGIGMVVAVIGLTKGAKSLLSRD